jgi:signal transduction histidine kinase
MKELSLHILDIVRNSINAGASLIEIKVTEDLSDNILAIEVNDNGKGMSTDILNRINDPFFTTDNKKTGLGIPLLRQHAEMCGGKCIILSEEYKGTRVLATFSIDHIDRNIRRYNPYRKSNLIRSNPEKDFIYTHTI